jgi:hypothetical protein
MKLMIKNLFSSTTYCRGKKTTKLEILQTSSSSSQCNKTDSNVIAAKLLKKFTNLLKER